MQNTKTGDFNPAAIIKVLIIDADSQSREACRTALEDKYLILEANTAINGIDLTIDTEPDLVFVSIDLPDMNGFEVASRLQILVPKTPIVALSEQVLIGTKDFGIAVGFYGYLQKPFTADEIRYTADEFLNGKKETVEGKDEYLVAYQSELAHRLELKVREQSDFQRRANYLIEQNNIMIDMLERRRKLLESAAKSAKEITSILNIDELLPMAAKTIQKVYDVAYFGIYLVDKKTKAISLAASACTKEYENNTDLESLDSIIQEAIEKQAAIVASGDTEESMLDRSDIGPKGSQVALPLIIGNEILGGIKIISNPANMFEETDITALQILADQLAIAIQNANTLIELDHANKEILRTKTFEAIATATGEAIHWVGNKAAPISGSARRVKEDLINFIIAYSRLLTLPEDEKLNHPFWKIHEETKNNLKVFKIDTDKIEAELTAMPPDRLPLMLDFASILEDLTIIQDSANTILNIKEDLIGPARKQEKEKISIQDLLYEAGKSMGLPKGVITYKIENNLPPVLADRRQLERVYTNLIKNSWEAMKETDDPRITISAGFTPESKSLLTTTVEDNGPGIPPEIIDKIWVSFFTTKKQHGGTGLGLSACMEIINQAGGQIHVESKPNQGAKFIVLLPYTNK